MENLKHKLTITQYSELALMLIVLHDRSLVLLNRKNYNHFRNIKSLSLRIFLKGNNARSQLKKQVNFIVNVNEYYSIKLMSIMIKSFNNPYRDAIMLEIINDFDNQINNKISYEESLINNSIIFNTLDQ